MTSYKNAGHFATVARQRARRAVEAGRAEYLHARPVLATPPVVRRLPAVEAGRTIGTPTNSRTWDRTRRFGEGLGARCPSYRSPVPTSDFQWWADQNAADEAREIQQMEERFLAQTRMDSGYEPY